MPNQNNPDPNTTNANDITPQPVGSSQPVSPVFPQSDLPPLPPDFQTVVADNSASASVKTSDNQPINPAIGSASPISTFPPVISPAPKKKFGGGRIIATILGIFLLVGGVAGGVFLTQQNQNIAEKAFPVDDFHPGNFTPDEQRGGRDTGDEDTTPSNFDSGYGASNTPPPVISVACGASDCDSPGFSCAQDNGTCSGSKPNCQCTYPSNQCGASDCDSPGFSCAQDNGTCLGQKPNCQCTYSGGGTTGTKESIVTSFGPIACSSSGYSNFDTGTVTEPCIGGNGGYLVEKIAHTGCPAGTPSRVGDSRPDCWCKVDDTNCGGQPTTNGGTTTTTITTGPSAQCLNVTAYSSTWTALTSAELSALTVGTPINFCVAGSASEATFDKAMFKINATLEAETTTKRPTSNDYCQSYTILSTDTTVNVRAKIHHTTLGWFGEGI